MTGGPRRGPGAARAACDPHVCCAERLADIRLSCNRACAVTQSHFLFYPVPHHFLSALRSLFK